ncbi:MAG TPA: MFS transporter [Drouetiella sp.]
MEDQSQSSLETSPEATTAPRKEILAWASYDIANSTYATVVATAVYNAYFANVIAGPSSGLPKGTGTLLLTAIICVSSILIVLTAPIIGTISDATASKKKLLFYSTFICIIATGFLSIFGPGEVIPAMVTLTLSNTAFGTGEDLIAAFLPELASVEDMGRISSIGWAAGYVGGLLSLGACLAYVSWALHQHQNATEYVPVVMLYCAILFGLTVLPTFVFLKERAVPDPNALGKNPIVTGFARLKTTVTHARHYRDLFRFLITLFLYSCGTTTIVHLASVYAQEVVKFTTQDSIVMILVVNVTAAIGASIFGFVQDRIGSVRTLMITLSIWTVSIFVAAFAQNKAQLWIAANLVGIAMGSTGSVGRALVGQFAPKGRSGEFLGLWGVAVKLATAVGAMTFGAVAYLTNNNYRVAILFTVVFFAAGFAMLCKVNEERGKLAARTDISDPLTVKENI